MATTPSPSGLVRRLLGRDSLDSLDAAVRAQARRLDAIEGQLAATAVRLDDLDATLATLHQTLVDADPAMTRDIVDAVRADVAGLVVSINELLGERASSARP